MEYGCTREVCTPGIGSVSLVSAAEATTEAWLDFQV